MKRILLALVLFAPLVALAQINQQCPQFTVNGTPQYQAQAGDQEIDRCPAGAIGISAAIAGPLLPGRRATPGGPRRRGTFRHDHIVPFLPQDLRQQFADAYLVVYHQYLCHLLFLMLPRAASPSLRYRRFRD